MRATLIFLCLIFPHAAQADEPMTEDEARSIALGLYQHVQLVAGTGINVREGSATETDPQRLLQAAAALIGAAAQFQEKRAQDLVAVSNTEGAEDSKMDKYDICALAATNLGNFAVGLSKGQREIHFTGGYFEQFESQFRSCGIVLRQISPPPSGGT